MDFIEHWLHISPDGGNGLLETVYLAVPVCAVTTVVLHRLVSRLRAARHKDR